MREQVGDRRQRWIVRRAGLVWVIGRSHAQHGSGLGTKAERYHCARRGLSGRAASKRRCRRVLHHLVLQTLLQHRHGLAGEVEPPRQTSRMRELIGDVRWRGQGMGTGNHKALRRRSQCHGVGVRHHRHAQPRRQQRELRRAALRRNTLAVPSLRTNQDGGSGVGIRKAHNTAWCSGREDEAVVGYCRLEALSAGSRCVAVKCHASVVRDVAQHRARVQRHTDHRRGLQNLYGRGAEQWIISPRNSVVSTTSGRSKTITFCRCGGIPPRPASGRSVDTTRPGSMPVEDFAVVATLASGGVAGAVPVRLSANRPCGCGGAGAGTGSCKKFFWGGGGTSPVVLTVRRPGALEAAGWKGASVERSPSRIAGGGLVANRL